MPLHIIRNDITTMHVDVIVNAANSSLLGGGGVDGAIHRAAGPQLREECEKLNGCAVGEAKITNAYQLPCKYVIHTVGPIWMDGKHDEPTKLQSCYTNALKLASQYHCSTIAFPLISSGIYGYPKDKALKVAVDTIVDYLINHDTTIYIVIFDRKAYQIGKQLFTDIQSYIDDTYVINHEDDQTIVQSRLCALSATKRLSKSSNIWSDQYDFYNPSLDEAISQIDESFSQMLFRIIDEKGLTDVQCYKRANIDRKLFSKIRSNQNYKPSKPTVMAFAIALQLSLEETKEMLMKAGFALSHSNKFDIIVEYFIKNGNYQLAP